MNNHTKIFGEASTILEIKKKEIILEMGEVENYLSFIIKGSVVIITYHNGNEICIGFSIENSFFSSYVSFLTRKSSQYQVVALEDTTIERIDFESLQVGYSLSAYHQEKGRKIAEQLYIKGSQRAFSLITKTAEERYLEFIETYPNLLQRIPLKYVASYLGVTPVSLSRIRNKIAKH
ncbi:Crp/Fnr family transcriptional regulator [uncultured Dokdonia sp.]|uniref:Crp/Fnr family transcriptional regulator n=1 Tax=uncultured Dokdonia sp. TaxID=575653 RepID=UPI002639290C|nr:Crp/Fnr family transcriptional regulator [uncultured Dokdonia sp.]